MSRMVLHVRSTSPLAKAEGDIKRNPALTKKPVVTKRGHVTTRYVRPPDPVLGNEHHQRLRRELDPKAMLQHIRAAAKHQDDPDAHDAYWRGLVERRDAPPAMAEEADAPAEPPPAPVTPSGADQRPARTLYHGTSAPAFDRFGGDVAYLAPIPAEAEAYAANDVLGGGRGASERRVLTIRTAPGAALNVDEEILAALDDGDVDEAVADAAKRARAAGYRYLEFQHPGVVGDDFTATVALYPAEDLAIASASAEPVPDDAPAEEEDVSPEAERAARAAWARDVVDAVRRKLMAGKRLYVRTPLRIQTLAYPEQIDQRGTDVIVMDRNKWDAVIDEPLADLARQAGVPPLDLTRFREARWAAEEETEAEEEAQAEREIAEWREFMETHYGSEDDPDPSFLDDLAAVDYDKDALMRQKRNDAERDALRAGLRERAAAAEAERGAGLEARLAARDLDLPTAHALAQIQRLDLPGAERAGGEVLQEALLATRALLLSAGMTPEQVDEALDFGTRDGYRTLHNAADEQLGDLKDDVAASLPTGSESADDDDLDGMAASRGEGALTPETQAYIDRLAHPARKGYARRYANALATGAEPPPAGAGALDEAAAAKIRARIHRYQGT